MNQIDYLSNHPIMDLIDYLSIQPDHAEHIKALIILFDEQTIQLAITVGLIKQFGPFIILNEQ